jgi:cobalt/nickel transport system permease protein
MNTSRLTLYQAGSSLIHDLDPRAKVLLTLLLILSNVLIPEGAFLALAAVWALLLLANQSAGIPLAYLLTRSAIVLPFTLAAFTTVFSSRGEVVFTLPWSEITATDQGLIHFGTIVFRSWISVQAAVLLTATTEFPDLIHALRHLKIPGVLVAIISFMYRYLFVLLEEVRRLITARTARSARGQNGPPGISLRNNLRISGSMVGQLFLRSVERSERIYQAMLSRGYRGHLLTLNPHHLETRDWLTLFGTSVFLGLIQLLAH